MVVFACFIVVSGRNAGILLECRFAVLLWECGFCGAWLWEPWAVGCGLLGLGLRWLGGE